MPRSRTYLSTPTADAPARPKSSRAARCTCLLLCGLSVVLWVSGVSAEELSVDEMVCVLDPQCSLPIGRHVRGITATSTSAHTPGSFDNHSINFEFNSARLTAAARGELDRIATALTNPNIEKYTIIIHGHTDGVGSAKYNQVLSERRAAAARQYFIAHHGIDPSRLVGKGHGMTQLLLPNDPTNEANRRVQFENANYAQAAGAAVPSATAPAATAPAATPPSLQSVTGTPAGRPPAPASSSTPENDGL
jgi:outer membrane protein OmpA-like peptidoglycan-associated protein